MYTRQMVVQEENTSLLPLAVVEQVVNIFLYTSFTKGKNCGLTGWLVA